MEFDTVYTRVCSWCCEIVIGTKNSSLISLQVMFFKCKKSTMERESDSGWGLKKFQGLILGINLKEEEGT